MTWSSSAALQVCEWFPVMNVQKKFCSDLMFACVLLTFEGRCLECEAAIRSDSAPVISCRMLLVLGFVRPESLTTLVRKRFY